MACTIPITNLYYLLSYAWNHRLSEAELVGQDVFFLLIACSKRDLAREFSHILRDLFGLGL